MIIILKNADFSANNIGSVVIPWENKDATAMMNRFADGTKSKEREYAFALFITKLQEIGLYENISYIGVPSLANTIADAYRNLKTGVALDYNPTDYSRYKLEKYGTYTSANGNNGQIKASLSGLSEVTLAIGTIEKTSGVKYMLHMGNMDVSYRVCAGSKNIVRPQTTQIGVNSFVTSASTPNITDANQFVCITNGVQTSPSLDGVETPVALGFNYGDTRFSGYPGFANSSWHNTGLETLIIILNKALSVSEAMALDGAISGYTDYIYEGDIDTIAIS